MRCFLTRLPIIFLLCAVTFILPPLALALFSLWLEKFFKEIRKACEEPLFKILLLTFVIGVLVLVYVHYFRPETSGKKLIVYALIIFGLLATVWIAIGGVIDSVNQAATPPRTRKDVSPYITQGTYVAVIVTWTLAVIELLKTEP